MKTVFIFGAGASADAGAPLMGNFLDKAEDLLRRRDPSINGLTGDFEKVFNVLSGLRAAVHEKSYLDLENIEAVFGAVEMAEILQGVRGIEKEEYKTVRTSLVRLIAGTLEGTIVFPTESRTEVRWLVSPVTYRHFVDGVVHSPYTEGIPFVADDVTFITFNYDICLDFALARAGLEPDYCLSAAGGKPRESSVRLLKLHGSLNWFGSGNGIVPVELRDTVLKQDGRMAPFGGQTVRIQMGPYTKEEPYAALGLSEIPSIVPPAWSKGEYHRTISNVWASAAQHLSQAENIIIVGYSLPETDTFFRYLFSLGTIGPTRVRNFIVVNPETSGATEERFRSLVGRGIERRFRYFGGGFSGVMDSIVRGVSTGTFS